MRKSGLDPFFLYIQVGLNNMKTRWRHFVKRFHPEGIHWPASVLYNTLSRSDISLWHYELVDYFEFKRDRIK